MRRNVSASTQNQALAALLFLYKDVLKLDLPWLADIVRAKKPQRLPVVLSVGEVRQILAVLDGERWLVCSLLYGTGMRLLGSVRKVPALGDAALKTGSASRLRLTHFSAAPKGRAKRVMLIYST